MPSLLLLLLLHATPAQDAPPPAVPAPFHATSRPWDLSMRAARLAPEALQPVALEVLDTALPTLVAVPAALLGGALGAVVGTFAFPWSQVGLVQPNPAVQAGAGAVAGAVGGTLLGTLVGDLVFNPFHLGHVLPARVAGALFLMPLVVVGGALVAWGVAPVKGLPVAAQWGAVGGLGSLAVLGAFLAPQAAVVAMVVARMWADQSAGSAYWEWE